jgi:cytochrome P450
MSGNLVSLQGPRHKYYRKLLMPPLQKHSVYDMGASIAELVTRDVETWPLGTPVDLAPLIEHLMRSVAVALLFGDDQARGHELAELVARHMVMNSKTEMQLCPLNIPGLPFRRMMALAEDIERCVIDFAASKRGRLASRDLLSIITNSPDETGAPPSEHLIAGHIPILFAASFETCQAVLTWTLFLLAQHPDVAGDLVDEVTAAFRGATPTPAQAEKLPLLNAVVLESLRILPSVPFQVRVSERETELAGRPLAKRTRLIISAYITNRLPPLYEEPDRFKPERWSRIAPSPFEFLTFSAGPRTCPGYWFGMSVVKVAVAAIVQRMRFTLTPGARIDRRVAITMTPPGGLPATLARQDQQWRAVPVTGKILDMVDLSHVH